MIVTDETLHGSKKLVKNVTCVSRHFRFQAIVSKGNWAQRLVSNFVGIMVRQRQLIAKAGA
jgi:hypothetical protein